MFLYLQGLILGAIIAIGCYFFGGINKMNSKLKFCTLITIIFGVSWLYYSIMPKDMMPNYLTTEPQIKLWTEGYKHMQYMTTLGMIVGVIIYILFM